MTHWSSRLSPALRELRIHLCPTSTTSAGARAFVKENYMHIKEARPTLPVLVREANGAPSRCFARFGISFLSYLFLRICIHSYTYAIENGMEAQAGLDGVNASEVTTRIQQLTSSPPQ